MDHLEVQRLAAEVLEANKRSSNAYDALLIPRNASFQDVRCAYKRLLFLHPDKTNGCDVASEAFKIISAAFNAIKNNVDGIGPGAPPQNVNNKWGAFTSSGVAPAAHYPERAAPTAPLAATTTSSKWGRSSASAEAQRMFNAPLSTTTNTAPKNSIGLPPLGQKKKKTKRTTIENIEILRPVPPPLEEQQEKLPSDSADGETQNGISSENFYNNSKIVNKPTVNNATFGATATASSRWGAPSRNAPFLAELLRNPVLPPTAASIPLNDKKKMEPQPKRRAALVVDSDDADEGNDDDVKHVPHNQHLENHRKGSRKRGRVEIIDSSSDDDWNDDDEEEEGANNNNNNNNNRAETDAQINQDAQRDALVALLQQHETTGRRAVAAQGARRRVKSKFLRRKRGRSKQTTLKLIPIRSAQ